MEFVYDRTQSDVARAAELNSRAGGWDTFTADEKEFWLNQLVRGRYNETDTNRVERNTRTLATLLASYGYNFDLTSKTDWAIDDFGTTELLENLLSNVKALAAGFTISPDAPSLPATMAKPTWQGANAIEKVQFEIERSAELMSSVFLRCGTTYSGGPHMYIKNGG